MRLFYKSYIDEHNHREYIFCPERIIIIGLIIFILHILVF